MLLLIVAATEPELRGADALADVETLACGVGPIDAAAMTAARLAIEPRPGAVLHVGIAGVRRAAGLPIGSVVVGEHSVYCDSRSDLVVRELDPDPVLLGVVRTALPDAALRTIGTSADVGGTDACDVEAMEGFAVLHAATLAGIPAVELRTVSNEIEEDDRALWRFDLALAALEQAVPAVVAALRR